MDYESFLKEKIKFVKYDGFTVEQSALNDKLKPHQKDIVQWCLERGRAAIFSAFGLGKTWIQTEILKQVHNKEGGKHLIVAPLGVRQEFKRDGVHLDVDYRFVRRSEEVIEDGFYITNYESLRDGKLNPDLFTSVSLDEASVLRSYGSKTYQNFLILFNKVKYRFVATATPSPNRYKELIHYAGFLGIMDTGQALAQPLTSNILTPSGWVKMGDIKKGDYVIDHNGWRTKVLGVYPQGKKDVYKITFSDGTIAECTHEHLWETQTQYERNAYAKFAKRNGKFADGWERYFTVKTTEDIQNTMICESTGSKNHSIPVLLQSVEFDKREVKFDPYTMGAILGDGHIRQTSISFTSIDQDIINKISQACKVNGLLINKNEHIRKDGNPNYDYSISTTGKKGGSGWGANKLLKACQEYGLCEKRAWEKFIPKDYIYNTTECRLEMLRGLMDTDGTISNNLKARTPKFITTSKQLANDVVEIVQSLGGIAYYKNRTGTTPRGNEGRLQYHVTIQLPNGINPFYLPRKANLVVDKKKYKPIRYITAIEKIDNAECQCIAVENNRHLYVTDNYILTHNTRFFQRDSTKANNLTLYPHMEKEFYLWLHSWAIFLQKPSDLGYDDAGYDLPEIKVHYHKVKSDITTDAVERDGQSIMFKDVTMNLQSAAKEKRDSLQLRVDTMMEIINADKDNHYLLWHDLEAERLAIKKALPESKDVYGSLDLEEREKRIIDFADGKFQYLSTKPRISGSGCNFQRHCHKAIFLGIGHKFNDFIQSIYRINRFLQKHTVEIHIIYTENETEVLKSLQTKWNQDNKLRDIMTEIIKKYKLSTTDLEAELTRNLGVARQVVKGENFTIAHNDCVDECSHLKDDSIDLIHTSIPFGNHYEYSANYNDFGHNDNNPNFFKQMDFLTPELLRVLKPGRIAAIHVKDRVRFGNVTGYGMPSIDPFHVDTIQHFRQHGFIYMGMVTIVTDVVRENNQTYRLGWTENCKDGTKMGVGCPEYVLLFRKLPTDTTTAYADNPVMKNKDDYTRGRWQIDAHAFWRSSGNRFLTADEVSGYKDKDIGKYFAKKSLESIYDYEAHVKVAEDLDRKGDLPSTYMSVAPGSHDETCWHDVSRMHTLNGNQSQRGLSNHICPLQFDIVDRIITRYTNEGDVVFDPFGGIMTVPYRALKLKRKAHASELNYDYFKDGLFYLEKAENDMLTPTLFELEDLA